MRRALPSLVAAVLVPMALAACGEGAGEPTPGGEGSITVVATTTQVTDLVRNVGGQRVEVAGLLGPDVDPHDYEPRPSDAEAIAGAKLVLRSGGDLDEWLDDVVESAGGGAATLTLIDRVRTVAGGHHEGADDHADEEAHAGEEEHAEDEGEDVDPHWWHDPRNAILAVGAIRDALTRADPGGRAAYAANATAYARRLEQLDEQIAACLAAVPAERRKLVTTHDALGYFAARYDIEVIGSVLDSLSTQAQPSAGDTRDLVEQMRAQDVRVLFAESSVAPRLERAIAAEAGARVGEPLFADTLGPPGSGGETYVGSTAANAGAIARGFTGGRTGCSIPAAE